MPASASRFSWWALALLAGLHAAVAAMVIRHGALNPDEGFYAAAARAVWEGAVPYRDFGYTQPPLLPYVNGLVLRLTGFGLFEQRAVNGLWAALALALAAVLAAWRGGPAAAVGLVLAFTLSAPWMYFSHLGKTYAFTGLLAVAAAGIWLEAAPGWRKAALLGLLGVLGTGCRLPAGPFFVLLWLAALAEIPHAKRLPHILLAGAVPALAALALLGPFCLAAPENAVFWVLEFHRVSVPVKTWHLAWQEIATLAPALWLATGVAAVFTATRHAPARRAELLLAGAALLTLAANLLPGGVYEEYAVPFLLPLAVPVASMLARGAERRSRPTRLILAGGLVGTHVAVAPLLLAHDFPQRRGTVSQWLTPNAPAFNPALPAQLAAARAAARAAVPPGRPLAGPNIILALETGRPVPPKLLMGPFSVSHTLPAGTAARLHLATPADIDALLADPGVPLLAFFTQPQLNYGWSMPTFERLPEAITRRWLEIYRRDFVVVCQEGNFLLLARRGGAAAVTDIAP
jgi:4-amino-4-deoxy-L-arabinose transferase-like glycosyltransferase